MIKTAKRTQLYPRAVGGSLKFDYLKAERISDSDSRSAFSALEEFCDEVMRTVTHSKSRSVLECTSLLSSFRMSREVMQWLTQQENTSFTLLDNHLAKVVLIHWPPGKVSSIHGHPTGGCMFKVLSGSVEELRYTPSESPKLLAKSTYHPGSMAYLDDRLGYHAVGNPFEESAVSLHVYTR